MTVAKNTIVTVDYTLSDEKGNIVEPGNEPIVYLHGGYGTLFPRIETALEGKKIGEGIRIILEPKEAFGDYNEELIVLEALSELPEDLEVGMEIEGYLESDEEDVILYTVVKIDAENAVLDANHPLAGIKVIFEGNITAIRPATADEIETKTF